MSAPLKFDFTWFNPAEKTNEELAHFQIEAAKCGPLVYMAALIYLASCGKLTDKKVPPPDVSKDGLT